MARLVRAALVAAVVAGVGAPGASAATFLVDDADKQCPNATFTSVAAAVSAANNNPGGDVVVVCPGTYEEQQGDNGVVIDQALTIRGAGAEQVRIKPAGDIGLAPGVDRQTGNIIWVRAPEGRVDISGVTIAADGRYAEAGVVFDNATGSLRNARITDLAGPLMPTFDEGQGVGVYAAADEPGHAVTVTGTLLEGYGKGGVVARSEDAANDLSAVVTDNVIRGRGPLSAPAQGQNGVQIRGQGTSWSIERNVISDHRFTPDESASVGILLFNAVPDPAADPPITDNDLQGNGYGVFNAGVDSCDNPTPVAAPANWWGNPAGPTADFSSGPPFCPPPVYAPTGSPALGDRVNGTAVDFTGFRTAPRGASPAPAPQPDARPDVTITSPADNTQADPGTPVTVAATATDDFDIAKVEFRRGATLVETDTTRPYSAAVPAPAAGESQAILATAFDSSGQTDAAAISLRGTPAPVQQPQPQPPPQTPQQVVEDQPPGVAFTGPSEGAAINPNAPPRLTADASDDRGVARVAFLDDGKVVCTDESAPYDCAYAPTGDDVGRNTLIAIAVDGAGQTAVAFRGIRVARFDPRLTAATTPKRDRKRPYRFTTSGSVLLPTGVTPAQACAGGGSVTVEFRAGKLRLPQTVPLRPDCSYRASIAFPNRRSLGRGRLPVSTKFSGNEVLGTAKGRTHRVQAG